MSDFAPGIESMKAAGIPVTVGSYGGAHESIDAIATKIRNGRLDSRLHAWGSQVLTAAGSPRGTRAHLVAWQAAYAKQAHFRPDPVGAEYVSSGVATLCLAPGLCVGKGDCDDGTVLLGSVAMGFGFPVVVTKQNFGPSAQEHVIIEVYAADEDVWIPVDAQPNDDGSLLPVGTKRPTGPQGHEEQHNPMDYVGSAGTKGPEIVTLGKARELVQKGGFWWEYVNGRWYVFVDGKWVAEPVSGIAAAMDGGQREMLHAIGFGAAAPTPAMGITGVQVVGFACAALALGFGIRALSRKR